MPDRTPSMKHDSRIIGRRRFHRSGKVIHSDGNAIVDCIILDASNSGARLKVLPPAVLPPAFTLLDLFDDRRYAVMVVWRRGTHVGVEFCDLTDSEDG